MLFAEQSISKSFFFALRQLRKSRTSSLLAIASLAIGIGASTAIYSLAEEILLHPLWFEQPDKIALFSFQLPRSAEVIDQCSLPRFRTYRAEQKGFVDLAAFVADGMTLTGSQAPELIFGQRVTANYFSLLKVTPIQGRLFAANEEESGEDLLIISESFWRKRLSRDPAAIGRTVRLNNSAYTIIGIVPNLPALWADECEYWTTNFTRVTGLDKESIAGGAEYLRVFGRRNPGVSMTEAQGQLKVLDVSYRTLYPKNGDREDVVVVRGAVDRLTDDFRSTFKVVFVAAVALLLAGCINVTGLLFVRFLDRQREIALRIALGASRTSVILLFLIESTLCAIAGGTVGCFLAYLLIRLTHSRASDFLPTGSGLHLNPAALGFGIFLSLLSGFFVALVPAWNATRGNLSANLREGGRGSATRSGPRKLRSGLLMVQVAISLSLLYCAALFSKTVFVLRNQSLGFARENVFIAAVDLPASKYPDTSSRNLFVNRILEEIGRDNTFDSVACGYGVPLANNGWAVYISPADGGVPQTQLPVKTLFRICSPSYFRTLGIPLMAGRVFHERDSEKSASTVVISHALAIQLYGNENPIGHRIYIGNDKKDGRTEEIVGMVGDVRSASLQRDHELEIYIPVSRYNFSYFQIVVRCRAGSAGAFQAVQAAVLRVDPLVPVLRPSTMDQIVDTSMGQKRVLSMIVGLFGGLSLCVTIIGLYTLASYNVTQRTSEMAVRLALGSTTRQVILLLLKQNIIPSITGIVVGLTTIVAGKSLLQSQLYGVSAIDPSTLGLAVLLLLSIAIIATFLPAQKIVRIDPAQALRAE